MLLRTSRYLHDTYKCFHPNLLESAFHQEYEVKRAREIISNFGINSTNPCQIAIDLHSTTSAMGSSIVIYGRRSVDLAIASLLLLRLGLPVYLHEGDDSQKGFLVEYWPCGLVVEIGPVAQGLLHPNIIKQTKLVLQCLLIELAALKSGSVLFPERIVVHRHIRNIDFPRSDKGDIEAFVHPSRQATDWVPIKKGSPLFMKLDGATLCYKGDDSLVPVFINEAAYAEKNIAMSLTKREVWQISKNVEESICNLINGINPT